MSKKNIILFSFLGLISGLLSWFAFGSSGGSENSNFFLVYGPGWIFGLVISSHIYFLYRKYLYFHITYIFISIGAYYVALKLFFLLNNENSSTAALFTAGLVGGLILAGGLRLKYPIKIEHLLLVAILGGLAGIIKPDLGIFPIWQTIVSTAIGFSLYKTSTTRIGI